MKKILMIVAAGLILTGCSSAPKENVTTCSESFEQTEITTKLISDDKGVVLRSEQTVNVQVEESQIDIVTEELESQKESLSEFKAVTYDYKIDGTTVTITAIINISELSDDELLQFGYSDEFKDENGSLLLDNFLELYETFGVTCTKN